MKQYRNIIVFGVVIAIVVCGTLLVWKCQSDRSSSAVRSLSASEEQQVISMVKLFCDDLGVPYDRERVNSMRMRIDDAEFLTEEQVRFVSLSFYREICGVYLRDKRLSVQLKEESSDVASVEVRSSYGVPVQTEISGIYEFRTTGDRWKLKLG